MKSLNILRNKITRKIKEILKTQNKSRKTINRLSKHNISHSKNIYSISRKVKSKQKTYKSFLKTLNKKLDKSLSYSTIL